MDVGDVLTLSGEDHWLESGLRLREGGRVIGSVFFAESRVVLVGPPPEPALHLAEEYPVPDAELPLTLEVTRATLPRVRRLAVTVEPLGKPPLLPAYQALFAEYADRQRVLWALRFPAITVAWLGLRVLARDVERWGR